MLALENERSVPHGTHFISQIYKLLNNLRLALPFDGSFFQ